MSLFRCNTSTDGKYISISKDSGNVWLQTESKVLFVRSCYNDIWGEIDKHYFTGGQFVMDRTLDGFVVSGNPGIGKSCFLDFCLHKLLEMRKSVCYFYGKNHSARIFKADGTVEEYKIADNHNGALAIKVDFLLIDPPENGDANFLGGRKGLKKKKFVLAVAPDRNTCQAILKDTSTIELYMGACSLQESKDMRVACYEQRVTEERLVLRYEEFGGIPRCLFKLYLGDDKDKMLNDYRAQQRQALRDVVANPNRIDDMACSDIFKSLWTIYHMEAVIDANSNVDYHNYTIVPCCSNAAIRIRDHLMKKVVRELWEVFTSTRRELGALRGIRYEAYAHKKILTEGFVARVPLLTQGGLSNVTFRNISIPAGSTLINLPNNNVGQELSNAVGSAMAEQKGGYLLPHLPNFPVLDSIFVSHGTITDPGPIYQLQMKAGWSRPLATERAASIEAATGCKELCFIVPDNTTITRRLRGFNWRQFLAVLKETPT